MTHITVVNGPMSGTQVALARGETCTIGSGQDCTIRIDLTGVAEVQAEIKALRQEGFGIKRAGGPVVVNGSNIEAVRLSDGDVIDVGSVQLLFGPPAAAPGGATNGHAQAGQMLGGFKLLEVLGKGGMGTVYRAEQVSLHRQVALKVLDQELTKDPVFVARFVAEARAAARLHHPNVVQVFDVGHEGSVYYYSMELMTEGSVETSLKAAGKLDLETACRAVSDAARGLAYAESLRIVHRDIKPDNLMLDHHGSVKLADLGLALTDDEDTGKVMGTPHFMSPEQILRKPLDHRSDLYSLGCTFYRLLTGKNPFSGASVKDILRAQVKDEAEPANKANPQVPVNVGALVQRLMEKEPSKRFQSANELVEALDAVLRPPVRKGLLIGGIVLAVAIAGGAIAFAVTRPDKTKIIKEVVTDPEAEANAKRARDAEAESAYLRVQTRRLTGLALAEALEAMAKEHAGCEHATKARDEAAKVRASVAAAEAAAAQRQIEIEAQVTALRARVRDALGKVDFRAAAAGLSLDSVPEALRADPALVKARDDLTAEVRGHADAKLRTLIEAVEAARNSENIESLERTAAALAAVLEGDGAWPKVVLPSPEQAMVMVTSARGDAKRLRAALASQLVEVGWTRAHAAFADGSGILADVRRLQWRAATLAADKVAAELKDQPAGAYTLGLAQSLAHAVEHLGRITEAAQAGTLTFPMPGEAEPCPVSAFVAEGEHAGLTVKIGPKHQPRPQTIKFAAISADALAQLLTLPGGDGADAACVLGWLELARQLEAARTYLSTLDPASDTAGTGPAAYPLNDLGGARLAEQLATRTEPWALALRDELVAANLLATGLQAFSSQRNLAAAELLDRLLLEHGRRIVVVALR